jgi:hypothetical protein
MQDMERVTKIIETKKMKHNGKAVASIVLAALSLAAVCFLYFSAFELFMDEDPLSFSFSIAIAILRSITFKFSIPIMLVTLASQVLGGISLYGQKNGKAAFGVCLSAAAWVLLILLTAYVLKLNMDYPYS